MRRDVPRVARIQLRPDVWDSVCDEMDWHTWQLAGEAMAVTPTTIARVYRGETEPGQRFIAAALHTTGCAFEELFEVIEG